VPIVAPPIARDYNEVVAQVHPFVVNDKARTMKRFAIVAVSLMAALLATSQAHAQTYGSGFARGSSHSVGSPTVSPYLNLLTADAFGNVGIGGGYQTLVKPFVDSRKAINANSSAISRLASGGGGGRGGQSRGGTHFMNYSHYYPMSGGR
jgi:hypothetical protein